MEWLRHNAELLSFALALIVAFIGAAFWLRGRDRSGAGGFGDRNVSQKAGDHSANVVSRGNANVQIGSQSDD